MFPTDVLYITLSNALCKTVWEIWLCYVCNR